MMTFLLTDESRALPDNSNGLTKGWVLNDDNCAMGTRRRQGGSVVMIWGEMIRNEVTGLFRVSEELKLSAEMYCSFLKKSNEP